MPRMIYPLKRLTLTKIRVKGVMRGCRNGTLKKFTKDQDVTADFKKTPIAQKMARYTLRKTLSDYQRFQVMILRKQRSYKATHLNAKEPVRHASKKKVEEVKEAPASPGNKKGNVPASPKR